MTPVPTVVVTPAAAGLTTGGEGLSPVEVAIRSRVFAGTFTNMQTVDPADDIASAIAGATISRAVLATKMWPYARIPPRPRGVLVSGPGATLRLRRRSVFSHRETFFRIVR